MRHDRICADCQLQTRGPERVAPAVMGALDRARPRPRGAQMKVSVPFWPTHASTLNQISMALPDPVAGSFSRVSA